VKRPRTSIPLVHSWLALVCTLVSAGLAPGQGTVVYHQPAEPIIGLVGLTLDLNGDGQLDARFYDASYFPANYYATDASGVGSARLLVTPNAGVDGGSHLVALGAGFSIGGPIDPSLMWAGQDTPGSYGDATVVGSYLTEDYPGSLVPVGYFYGTTAFMGIAFQIASEWHYGWVRVRGGTAGAIGDVFYLNPPGWIVDWAYETRPDTPILAGAIPEPSASTLLTVGGILLWLLGRASQIRSNSAVAPRRTSNNTRKENYAT
jgi:hypothetical protein